MSLSGLIVSSIGIVYEHRAGSSFTDLALSAFLAHASGADINATAQGSFEIAAGLWSRAFASAHVEPQTAATASVTPAVLAGIGRELVSRGEAVFEIAVDRVPHRRSIVELIPVGNWDVHRECDRLVLSL